MDGDNDDNDDVVGDDIDDEIATHSEFGGNTTNHVITNIEYNMIFEFCNAIKINITHFKIQIFQIFFIQQHCT